MKRLQFLLLTFISLFIFQLPGIAQQVKGFDIFKDDIEDMIPPLQTIIDTAISRNPFVKLRDIQVDMNSYKLKAFKRDWTRNLGVQTDILYGTFNNVSANSSQGQNTSLLSTRSIQLNYGAGGFIRLPLYDLINRRNQNRLAKADIDQAQSYAMEQRTELRQIVIKQYNELIIKHRLLKIRSKYIETARIHMEMAEKQFLNGVINVAEFTSVTEIVARGEAEFETSKMEFRTSFMLLEEISGMKFNLANKLK